MNQRTRASVRLLVAAWCVCGARGVSGLRAADPVITEILADNFSVVADEDGDFPDCIEIFNPGPDETDLEGWHLTDDRKEPTKWTFPLVSVPPGGYLLVFASGKDRARPGRELHTNFRLAGAGDFVGLAPPGGGRFASQVGPGYPRQFEDVSYGAAMTSEVTPLVTAGAPVRVLVPGDDAQDAVWTAAGFDDASWKSAALPVGYDRKSRPSYADLLQTDLLDDMYDTSATVYVRLPFNVADPSAIETLILRAKYDDGFVAYINGVEVARRNAPEGSPAWDAAASARRLDVDALAFEDINISVHASLLQAGGNLLAVHELNYRSRDSDCFLDLELVGSRVTSLEPNSPKFFSSPTLGWANSEGAIGVSRDPGFSQASGVFTEAFDLTLTADSPGVVIRYTLDRSEPTEESDAYSEPIPVSTSTVVKARVYEPGLLPGRIITRAYFLVSASLKDWSSNLPIVIIDTFGRPVSGTQLYSTAYTATIETSDGGRSHWGARLDWAGRSGIKLRGSSSRGFPKNNYSFEVRDEHGEDLPASLLGLPAHPDWVLHGPYSDKTLMRNYLAYKWSNDIGQYASRTRFCEVFLNLSNSAARPTPLNSSHYRGVYLLVERIKRGKDRVNVQRMYASETEEPEVSGGYILKKDRVGKLSNGQAETGFRTLRQPGGSPLVYVYPKEEFITPAQKVYIRKYMDQFEAALFSTTFADPETGYAAYIDVDSFIDHHILTELLKNIDGYRLSTYLYKDRGGKLFLGPLWDFNLSLGNANYLAGWTSAGWYYPQLAVGDYPWFPRLFQDPNFEARYRARWAELRQGPFRIERLLGDIDATAALLDEAQARNYTKWRTLGTYIWPNWFIGKTYAEEIDFMRTWLAGRVDWIDSVFTSMPDFSQDGGEIPEGFELEITSDDGTVFYTLDGSDPKMDGGDVPSAAALEYTGPIVLAENTRVTARARVGGSWSKAKAETFFTHMMELVITEIMPDPRDPPEDSPYTSDAFEFVELMNRGAEPLDLTGVRFLSGITFDFTTGDVKTLGPGEYVVIVRNLEAFATRHDTTGIRIAGEYSRNLSNLRATLKLLGPLGEELHRFRYQTDWYPEVRGGGYSLVIRDPDGPRDAWASSESWRASTSVGGSPGVSDGGGFPAGGWQLPGDVSQDGRISVTDAIHVVRILFQGAAKPCDGASVQEGGTGQVLDVNGDSSVNIGDAVGLLNYLFRHGPPPALGTACVRVAGCPDVCTP